MKGRSCTQRSLLTPTGKNWTHRQLVKSIFIIQKLICSFPALSILSGWQNFRHIKSSAILDRIQVSIISFVKTDMDHLVELEEIDGAKQMVILFKH